MNDASPVSVAWLPGGAWAASEAPLLGEPYSPPEALHIEGLAEEDEANIRCSTTGRQVCSVDLILGGNWIKITGFDDSEYSPAKALDARETATTIAAAIVARLRG